MTETDKFFKKYYSRFEKKFKNEKDLCISCDDCPFYWEDACTYKMTEAFVKFRRKAKLEKLLK